MPLIFLWWGSGSDCKYSVLSEGRDHGLFKAFLLLYKISDLLSSHTFLVKSSYPLNDNHSKSGVNGFTFNPLGIIWCLTPSGSTQIYVFMSVIIHFKPSINKMYLVNRKA